MLLIGMSVFASGCTMSDTSVKVEAPVVEERASSQWDTPFARLGVVPVLPPSEDVRVGDMFVYPFNPDSYAVANSHTKRGGGGIAISPRWGTLKNLLPDLEEEYQLRPDWPATPDTFLQSSEGPEKREWLEPTAEAGQSVFAQDTVPGRLRNFGVPEFSAFTLTEGDVNSFVPTEAINLVLGSAWNDNKAISIRMNSAETYSLGLHKVIESGFDMTDLGVALKTPYRDNLALVADPSADTVWIRLLSDVVYLRSIDIIIQSKSAFSEDEETNANEFSADNVKTTSTVEEQSPAAEENDSDTNSNGDSTDAGDAKSDEQEEKVVIEVVKTVVEENPDVILDPAFVAFVRANAINELLIKSGLDDLPGGFLRFISITDDSVTVRRVWQRGLAVGGRGLTLEVDKVSGDVLRSGNMGTLLP